MRDELDRRDGVLGLAMIKNVKTVDPADPTTPEVIQIETAMGAAIEVFDGATTIEVGRDRFVPVKTTNDLLVLRSDCYELDERGVLHQIPEHDPFVDLDSRTTSWSRTSTRASPTGCRRCGGAASLRVGGLDLRRRGHGRAATVELVADTGSPGTIEPGRRRLGGG